MKTPEFKKSLSLKELKVNCQLQKCLARAYARLRTEIIGVSFTSLQPLNYWQQYMAISNLQFTHDGEVFKLVFLTVLRKAKPEDLRYDRAYLQDYIELNARVFA